ncbi:xanthine dehydrogenase small subunit [Nesterenkonia xinjiangensis]|uniref:Xanthine dehydrogenase small subunit n=1 Tax=Nesterenkonia xinjiangensis TaxID=225327 RepID=A0A7Z0GIU5_9MICC|nr:FAD binding domain-containing protein [Nesterenkonia xinjiangensis]NYJ76767.1 xanthine dehydrogenase small subunit [Nesterenkonia xinjiangensis]
MAGSWQIRVNGRDEAADEIVPRVNLLDWLRSRGLTGAKEGCAEGECGACAVLVARPDGPQRSRWTAVNACLPPAAAFVGHEVITAEGLAGASAPDAALEKTLDELHPVQQEMARRGGSQCGYCTPGFVCAMAAEYYRADRAPSPVAGTASDAAADCPSDHGANGFDLHALSGNLCRCTGYRPIRDAAYALGAAPAKDPLLRRQDRPAPAPQPTVLTAEGAEFRRPATWHETLERLAEEPGTVLVAGATDLGVERNIRHSRPPKLMAIDHLEELRHITRDDDVIDIGAGATLSEIERALAGQVPLLSELLPQFASRLIRNTATLGGNLGTASPIGDSAPTLLALDAVVVLASAEGERHVALEEFFTGYRQTVLREGELIRSIRIPLPLLGRSAFHKIAKRRFDDISSVAVAIALQVADGIITEARIGLGGVAATPLRAAATEQALRGRPWSEQTIHEAAATMAAEGTPLDDLRASARYRAAMLHQALPCFHAAVEAAAHQEVSP